MLYALEMLWVVTSLIVSSAAAGAKGMTIECKEGQEKVDASILYSNAHYPESPLLVGRKLYFVEYAKDQVTVLEGSAKSVLWSKKGCGPAAITQDKRGEFLVTCYDSNSIVRLSSRGQFIKEYHEGLFGVKFKGPNDFAGDADAGHYFSASGVFKTTSPVEGEIFFLAPDESITKVATGIHYANGLAVVDDGRGLLVSEHLKNRIIKYQIQKDGSLSDRAVIFADLAQLVPQHPDLSGGLQGPDGMKVGKGGVIYVAQYAGSRIIKINSSGSLVGVISIESEFPNTTNVWVEGDSIYVSAAQETSGPEYSGVLFEIHDKNLSTRKNLKCKITSQNGASP